MEMTVVSIDAKIREQIESVTRIRAREGKVNWRRKGGKEGRRQGK